MISFFSKISFLYLNKKCFTRKAKKKGRKKEKFYIGGEEAAFACFVP
jgi:hypothetical protein